MCSCHGPWSNYTTIASAATCTAISGHSLHKVQQSKNDDTPVMQMLKSRCVMAIDLLCCHSAVLIHPFLPEPSSAVPIIKICLFPEVRHTKYIGIAVATGCGIHVRHLGEVRSRAASSAMPIQNHARLRLRQCCGKLLTPVQEPVHAEFSAVYTLTGSQNMPHHPCPCCAMPDELPFIGSSSQDFGSQPLPPFENRPVPMPNKMTTANVRTHLTLQQQQFPCRWVQI